jgi:phosphoglycerate dehydrogenase-like enzyme
MKVFIAESPLRAELGELPAGVQLVAEPAPDVELAIIGPADSKHLGALVAKLPGLKVLQSTWAGVDALLPHVPEEITLCTASGAHDVAVSEWVLMTLLALRRRLPEFLEYQREGRWDVALKARADSPATSSTAIEDLDGARVVILGYGSIGRAVGAKLRPFGVEVVGFARRAREGARDMAELDVWLPRAAAVIVLLPLAAETRGLIDAAFLAKLRPGTVLINAARGPLVDTGALLAELQARRLYAGLDVTDPEPLPAGHPLWKAPNLILTPHVSGATSRWLQRAYRLAGEQLRAYASGAPLRNVVERTGRLKG